MGPGITNPPHFGRAMRLLAVLLASIALLCQTFAPVQANAFVIGGVTLKNEKEMGRKFNAMIRSSMPMVEDPEVTSYVADVLGRLVKAIPRQPFEFQSAVVLHPSLNAFAIPGGFVFMFTGMLMNLDNEAELAGVLAHELAHVTLRHVAARMERSQYMSLGALLAGIAGIALGGPVGVAAAATAQAAMLNYSRMDESEADNTGLQYLTAAGYPAEGMTGGLKKLRQRSYLAGINVPTYLSTHPAIGDRVNSLSSRIAAMPESRRNQNFDNSRFERVKTLLWARYGDEQAALQIFKGAHPLSLMGRGIVLSRQNRVPEARDAFAQALNKAPHDALIMREAGIFHFRKGDMKLAEKLLSEAMRKDHKDYMAAFYYGRLLDETGRQKQAPRFYQQVLRYIPHNPEVHDAYGRSLGQAGDSYRAYVHLALGAIYSNNRKLADEYYRRAKSLAEKAKDQEPFARLEAVYNERKELWGKS